MQINSNFNIAGTVLFLGAVDPEMEAIEKIAILLGCTVIHMHDERMKRCYSYNAYQGVNPLVGDNLIFIECAHRDHGQPGMVIDHHRPGDPGYDMGPAEYWEASSLGQFCRLIGITPEEATKIIGVNALVVAADDHCLSAAHRGECPGVPMQEFSDFRDWLMSRFRNRSAEEHQLVMESAKEVCLKHLLTDHPTIGGSCVDLSDCPSLLDEASEVSARMRAALLLKIPHHSGGKKWVLLWATPEQVYKFKQHWEAKGLIPYTKPKCGIAVVVEQ